MQMRYILELIVAALLTGWMMPFGPATPPPVQPPLLHAQIEPEPETNADAAEFEMEGVTLSRQRDGHFYANAAVNEGEVRFLVDTGASAIALTGADADALGIEWDENELQLVGRGVSGDVYGKPVILKSVQLGDIVAYDVAAAIIPSGLDVSLLGQSFLSKVGNVNIQGDQMTFE